MKFLIFRVFQAKKKYFEITIRNTLVILDGIIVTIQPFYEKCKDEYLTYRRTSGVIAPFSKKNERHNDVIITFSSLYSNWRKFDIRKFQMSKLWLLKIGSSFGNLVVILAVEGSILCSLYKHGTRLYINSSQI